MDCCNHNSENKNEKAGKPRKHMPHWVMMILCCGLPLVLLMLLPYIGRVIPGAQGFLGAVIPLLCPIMMGFMIFNMFKGGKEKGKNDTHCETDK